jgi:hypothetical protein
MHDLGERLRIGFGFHSLAFSTPGYGIVDVTLRGGSMIDNEKFQKGRGWAYLAGIVMFLAVVAWKFVTR